MGNYRQTRRGRDGVQMSEHPIEYWRIQYLIHAKKISFQRHVRTTQEIVVSFLSRHPDSYVSWSGGKDSTVLVHLCKMISPDIPIMSEKDDMDFPEEIPYLRMMQKRYELNLEIISPEISLWDAIGKFTITEDVHSRGAEFSETFFYKIVENYRRSHGFSGVLLGLRKEESRGRLLNRCSRGLSYERSGGEWVCQPLADWSAADIFGYLFSYEIPILPVYFKTKFVTSPEEIRKSWVLPSARASKGQAVWLNYYYPEIFNRLAATNPEIRRYL
jgi:phosphoadenosine phosphosulfate reductase